MAIEQLSSNSDESKGEITKDDIVDELNKDDEPKGKEDEVVKEDEEDDEDTDEKPSDDSDDEGDEDEETKEDDEIKLASEDDDESLEDVKLVVPFKKAEIEKDFPGIFKKYPYLEKSYYTERAYREVFASPEEAKEAAESLEELHQTEQTLLEGSTSDLITRVKNHDENAYNKLVDNYLGSLQKVDPEAHNHVVGGIVKNLVVLLAREAKSTDNDELRKVALAINKFVFNTDQFEPHKKLAGDEKEVDKINEERKQFIQERFEVVQEELQTKVDDVLLSTIKNNIDPKSLLTDYVKKNAVRDAMDDLREKIAGDKIFRKQLDRLWERAFAANFNRETSKAIKDAYLSKARVLLKPVITKAKNEALKGIGKRVREDSDSDTEKSERRPYHKGTRGSTTSDKGGQKKADIPRGMSTLDFLNKD